MTDASQVSLFKKSYNCIYLKQAWRSTLEGRQLPSKRVVETEVKISTKLDDCSDNCFFSRRRKCAPNNCIILRVSNYTVYEMPLLLVCLETSKMDGTLEPVCLLTCWVKKMENPLGRFEDSNDSCGSAADWKVAGGWWYVLTRINNFWVYWQTSQGPKLESSWMDTRDIVPLVLLPDIKFG